MTIKAFPPGRGWMITYTKRILEPLLVLCSPKNGCKLSIQIISVNASLCQEMKFESFRSLERPPGFQPQRSQRRVLSGLFEVPDCWCPTG